VSPLRPRGLFVAEALVGFVQLTLVTLSDCPCSRFWCSMVSRAARSAAAPFIPLAWGAVTGLGLTVWSYESAWIRRLGEKVAMAMIVVYLVVGVLAGENLREWLAVLPMTSPACCCRAFFRFHTDNPFGVMRYWFNGPPSLATSAAIQVTLAGVGSPRCFCCGEHVACSRTSTRSIICPSAT